MKVWVISVDIVYKDESYNYAKSVYKSKEDAEVEFDQLIEEGESYKFDTQTLEDDVYETYDMGWYYDGHFVVKMEEMEVQ